MNKIVQLLKNIKYLSEVNLRDYTSATNILTEPNRLKYAVLQQFHENQLCMLPKIKTYDETLDLLINTNCSIARFGDGEFNLICGKSIAFQNFDSRLQKRLKEILLNKDENFFAGIPRSLFHYSNTNTKLLSVQKDFLSQYYIPQEQQFYSFLDLQKEYIPTEITQMYMMFENYDFDSYFEKAKKIWENKDIVIACGDRVFDNIENNIFDCAASIEYVHCPTTNAFSQYDEILDKLKHFDTSKLMILILGPTAKLLAADLHSSGYRALDLGHIAKDYDAFCKKLNKDSNTISSFFAPD